MDVVINLLDVAIIPIRFAAGILEIDYGELLLFHPVGSQSEM